MSPKARKSNKHLPQRVYIKHGAYYFVNSANKWIRLGSSFSEAMATWTKIVAQKVEIETMNQLFDRYMREVAPLKAPSSYKANIFQMAALRLCFGDTPPQDIEPIHIYKYMDKRKIKASVSANREKALLSHVFSMAIRWGVVKDNPCRNVKRITERPRKRYIEDWEYMAVRSVATDTLKYLMDFAYLTGQRIGDILTISLSDLTDEGIKIEQNKTGTKIIIRWSDELRKCVEAVKKLPRAKVHSFNLFPSRRGTALTYNGFSTIWERTMKKAISEGLIQEKFTFHDIRAKSSSDTDNRQNASELLGHSDTRITERVYNRKHKKVSPIR